METQKNPLKVKAGKAGSASKWKIRYETLTGLQAFVSDKKILDWFQNKWKTTHLVELLKAYKTK